MENKTNNDSIREIVDLVNEKVNAPEVPSAEEASNTEEKPLDTGLVFELNTASDPDGNEGETEDAENSASEETEMSVPETLEIDEKYNTPATDDTLSSPIKTTYVPRFTEVSETYRMKDDPRRVKNPTDAAVVVDTVAQPMPADESDPTAEIESVVEDVVIVRQAPPKEDEVETVNIYKFDPVDDEPDEELVAEEIAEIESLIGKSDAPSTESAVEEVTLDVADEESEPEPEEEEELIEEVTVNTRMPDPEPSEFSVIDYTKSAQDTALIPEPEGVVELSSESVKSNSEFTHTTQRDSFKDKFLDSLMSVKIRLFAILLFSLLLLGYETLAAFGVLGNIIGPIAFSATTVGLVDLVFVVCLFALVIPEMTRAIRNLFDGRIVSDLMLIPALILSACYSLVIVLSPTATDFILVGFIFATMVMSVIFASYFRLKGDFTAFKVVSKVGEKRILDRKLTRELPEENAALDGLIDEYKSRTARIFRVGFISDFFKRIARTSEDSKHVLRMLVIAAGVSFVTGLVCLFILGGVVYGFAAFALVFLLACPAMSILSHKLPYNMAQNTALTEESTVVGETSYDEFSEVDVVAFDDTEIFGPDDVNLRRFMLYGDSDSMEKAMQQMCSLFAVAGGPLKFIFENALDRRVRHSPAIHTVIEEDGISGNVSGRMICAGTEEYMRRRGIAIPDASSRIDSGIDTTKIMYAAEDGEIYARFHIRYSFSEEFTSLLPTLKDEGIIPVIYTRDPNVSNELLRILSAGNDCMRVVKRTTPDVGTEMIYRNVSAGVVSYGDKINAINIVLLAKRYKKLIMRMKNIEMYAMGAGLGLGVVISVLGMFTVPSFVFGLWQAAWCAVLAVASHSVFKKG